MSCGPAETSFRLLDCFVGWDEQTSAGIGGLDDPAGLFLLAEDVHAVGEDEIDARLPPARLAHGCGCEWFLASDGRLLVRDACGPTFRPTRFPAQATAVASWGSLVATVFADVVAIHDLRRGVAPILLSVPGARAVALAADRLIVAGADLRRFDLSGALVSAQALPGEGVVDRVAVIDGHLWLVLRHEVAFHVFVDGVPATREQLAELPPSGVSASDEGFCLDEPGPRGARITRCYRWDGTPGEIATPPAPGPARLRTGTLVTQAIDSGLSRCRWHRVRVDADLPAGTSVLVEVASSEAATSLPHAADWTAASPGRTDFLIAQPPGRFLFLRLTLSGDGRATPRVRRIRLDLPRATSLDRLPEVYRDDPEAAEFSERFLSLFDAQVEELDRAIERFPALLDAGGVPDEVLPWLASLVGVAFDPAWEPARRRALLEATPSLYRQRGTLTGLQRAIQLVLGVEPVIEEVAATKVYSAVRGARLGTTRLYGRSRARFRVGSSPLGGAPVRSYGDPDDDVARAGAYRLRVRIPPVPGATREQTSARLRRLVEAQKPAHVAVETSVGGGGCVLGGGLVLGVDTLFAAPPAPILGRTGNIRLRRSSVLWPARREP